MENPSYTTPTDDLMTFILKVLPLSSIKYTPEDLEDCTLRKYKNCIMFELKKYPNFKIVWHFVGKLYIGEWNSIKNEKDGFGK